MNKTARQIVSDQDERRERGYAAATKLASLILDDDTIKVNNLDIHVAQINGPGDFMAYLNMSTSLNHERLTHLMKLAELYSFEAVVLDKHDSEGRYNLRLWPNRSSRERP